MPATATFTANAIIVTIDDGERRTERAFHKLSCFGRVIEDIAGADSGEKVLSIVYQSGEPLISLSNNPALYPGNSIDGQTSFDAAKTSVFDAIGLSVAGGGGGGGTSLTQSQTRDAVKDGLDASVDIEALKILCPTNPGRQTYGVSDLGVVKTIAASTNVSTTSVKFRRIDNNTDKRLVFNFAQQTRH